MDKKYQIVALVGRSGAGKDTLVQETCNLHPSIFHKIINCTTRPSREYELEAPAYNFMTLENFTRKILNKDMLEATEFNGWFYGTLKTALDINKINVGVFNVSALRQLQQNPELNILAIKVDALDKTCLLRTLNREENPDCEEICRRFLADSKDLAQINGECAIVYNEDGNSLDLLQNARIGLLIEDLWNELDKEALFAEAMKADEVHEDNID